MADKPITQVEHLPNGWIEVPLGEICTHPQYGWTTKARNFGTIKLLRTTDISSGEVDWTTVPFCSQVPTDLEKYLIEKDDILVSRAGSVGLSFRIKEVYNFKSVFASYLIRFKVIKPIIPQWVEFFFKSSDYFEQISNMVSGIALPTVNASKLNKLKIPIAPISEQIRIVKIIEEKMSELEYLKKVLKEIPLLLKLYRQAVINAAATGKLTEEWRMAQEKTGNSSILLGEIAQKRLVNNIKTKNKIENLLHLIPKYFEEVPNSWSWTNLFNIGGISSGIMKGRKTIADQRFTLPYLRVANVQDGYLNLTEVKNIQVTLEERERYLLKYGDLLFTEGGDRDKLGRGAIWQDEIPECLHQNHIFRCRLFEEFTKREYILAFTRSESARRYFYENASQTVNLASINMNTLGSLPIPIPPYEEQVEIVRQINELFKLADDLEKDYAEAQTLLKELPQQLLEQAFSGKLTDQDPNDEPASTLMERIRIQLDSLKEQSKTVVQQRKKMATTQKSKTKNLAEAIVQNFSDNAFTFEELASTLSEWGYEDLKDDVFNLLKINKLAMNFDQSKEFLTFKLSGHDD